MYPNGFVASKTERPEEIAISLHIRAGIELPEADEESIRRPQPCRDFLLVRLFKLRSKMTDTILEAGDAAR
jgi:hypothetical protein